MIDALERLKKLAQSDVIARSALDVHLKGGEPLINAFVFAAETWSQMHQNLTREMMSWRQRAPLPPVVIVTSEAERDRIKALFDDQHSKFAENIKAPERWPTAQEMERFGLRYGGPSLVDLLGNYWRIGSDGTVYKNNVRPS